MLLHCSDRTITHILSNLSVHCAALSQVLLFVTSCHVTFYRACVVTLCGMPRCVVRIKEMQTALNGCCYSCYYSYVVLDVRIMQLEIIVLSCSANVQDVH